METWEIVEILTFEGEVVPCWKAVFFGGVELYLDIL